MVWVSREGQREVLPAPPRRYAEPTVSPDGTRIAVTIDDPDGTDIWIWSIPRETLSRLTVDPSIDIWPLWTPDGAGVVFLSSRGRGGLFRKTADGSGDTRQLLVTTRGPGPYAWTPDGRLVVSVPKAGSARRDVAVVASDAPGGLEPLLDEPFHEQRPAISPDGRWLAYGSRESGRDEIYVRPFPDVGRDRWRVSGDGGRMAQWAPDGRELFYLTRDHLVAVGIETTSGFGVGTPDVLFGLDGFARVGALRHYDVAPDGRFLMLEEAGPS
jgi:serine/threonine-protein kinase